LCEAHLFEATGATGRHLVGRALASGRRVTAVVRTPAKMELSHPQLSVVGGDVTDAASIAIWG